jgi:transposase-like protein
MASTINSRANVPAHAGRARRRRYGAAYKLEILAEYETLDRDGKGELLRREVLYTSLLSEWRKQRDRGAIEALAGKPGRPPLDPFERENTRLRHRVERLEDDLERARTVIEVQGKCSALLEELATDSAEIRGDETK